MQLLYGPSMRGLFSPLLLLLSPIIPGVVADENPGTNLTGHLTANNISRRLAATATAANGTRITKAQIVAMWHFYYVSYPILLSCCTIGNSLNLVVLAKEKSKGSTNIYMTVLAISDLFVIWFELPDYWWEMAYQFNISGSYNKQSQLQIKHFNVVRLWGQDSFTLLCDWVLIVFSLERMIAIFRPFKRRVSLRAVRILIGFLFTLAALLSSFNIAEGAIKVISAHHNMTYVQPVWLREWAEFQIPFEIIMRLFKFFALLIINMFLICILRKRLKDPIYAHANIIPPSGRDNRYHNILLLGSVVLYLITSFPAMLFSCLQVAEQHQIYHMPKGTQRFIVPFAKVFVQTNYSVNFFLYLTVSRRYREQFREVMSSYCQSRLQGLWPECRSLRLCTCCEKKDLSKHSDLPKGEGGQNEIINISSPISTLPSTGNGPIQTTTT